MKRLILVLAAVSAIIIILLIVPFAPKQAPSDQTLRKIAGMIVGNILVAPLESFRLHLGRYPTTEEGLQALVIAPKGSEALWRGPYIEPSMPNDPWGRPYQYRCPATKSARGYDFWSLGPDPAQEGDDVGNWETPAK